MQDCKHPARHVTYDSTCDQTVAFSDALLGSAYVILQKIPEVAWPWVRLMLEVLPARETGSYRRQVI